MTKKMSSTFASLLLELDALLRLTRAEAQIARVRVAQARRDDIREELEDNARDADERAARIQAEIRRLGGVRDVFADAAGRVAVFARTAVEQGQPFSEGLLGDLALVHQLRDRAQFARVLAEAEDDARVADLVQDLENAHTETIEWIRVRLAEVAQGEPALAPTAAQAAVAAVARVALLPVRQGAGLFNRTVHLLQRGGDKAEQKVDAVVDRAQANAGATREVLRAGRDAALARAEEVAPSEDVRRAAHEAREELGTIDVEDLPIQDYDDLTAPAAIDEINELDDADDVRVVLHYERAHKDRKGVSAAAQQRLTELAEESVDA